MSGPYTIYYWIRGRDPSTVASVDLSPDSSITNLRDALRRSHPHIFHDPDNSYIRLFQPPPISEPYEENLSTLALSQCGRPLRASQRLSQIFSSSGPKADCIHIIVDTPTPTVRFWIRGAPSTEYDFVELADRDAKISHLQASIRERCDALRNIPPNRIRLYKVSGTVQEVQEALDKVDEGSFLPGGCFLHDAFLDLTLLEEYQAIVQISEPTIRSTFPPSLTHNRGAATRPSDPIRFDREIFTADRPGKDSPSSGARPSAFRELQANPKTRTQCGRPRDAQDTIPATLLHPVFGQFLDDCRAPSKMSENDNTFVAKLADAMSALHVDEVERLQKVSDIFKWAHIDFRLNNNVNQTKYTTDADLRITLDGVPHSYVIAEFKNEAATSVSEPYMQAVAYYVEATKGYAPRMSGIALPSFLLVLFGPYLVIAGAVWNLRPSVQVLSTPLSFLYHDTDVESQLNAARHMTALRKAIRSLEQYYRGLSTRDRNILRNTAGYDTLFPYSTGFKSLEDQSTRTFRYTAAHKKTRLVFFGETLSDGHQICIKFVQRYSAEVHQFCASSGFAPKLLGFERLPGGWNMVVMDRLVGFESLADLSDDERLPSPLFESIGHALEMLHGRQMVHGDVRDSNIMVRKDDRTTFSFVDFDWGGMMGDARYPPYVNYVDIQRPEGARDGELILAAHDDDMLRDLSSNNRGE